jgi:signal transduction histidine kinase/CheY-like chemotaxis protein
LSENSEQLSKAALLLMDIKDVSYVSLYNKQFKRLTREGAQIPPELGGQPKVEDRITYSESPGIFEFTAPVFSIKARADFDFFQDKIYSSQAREHIGWVRIGMSKEIMSRSESEIIRRGVFLAVAFSLLGLFIAYIFVSIAIRPLQNLIRAVKDIRKGGYPEVPLISPKSEIGKLSYEFNRMSREIRDREERLVASEVRMKAMFERVEHAIFRIDRDGKIVITNKKFDDLFGNIENFGSLFSGNGTQYLKKAAFGALRHSEERIRGKDGTEIVVIMSVYPELDESGEISGFDGYFVDVTDKKKLEETLIQSQKMESVGLLAGGIAHDFNNILTGVLGYASLMKGMFSQDEKAYKYSDVIEKSAIRASNLTQQLLGFARKGKYKIENFNANDIVKELISFLREAVDRSIELKLDMDPNLPAIRGDSTQLYQALLNVCINARDAMPGGGKLYIRTEYYLLANDKVVDFFKVPAGEYVRINVTDTGSGMSADVKKRIFEPFFTTKVVGKGTGLGLAMVYGIVKGHNGYLTVYSEPGLGTTMRFYFPKAEGLADEKREAKSVGEGIKKGTILLVDDEELVRELGKEVLEAYNYSVLLAANGNEGVSLFNRHKQDIDLVILDMVMPGKGGKQVFTELRTISPDIKVIISSGYGQDEYFHEMFDTGVVGFLQKPFQHSELINKVEESMAL